MIPNLTNHIDKPIRVIRYHSLLFSLFLEFRDDLLEVIENLWVH